MNGFVRRTREEAERLEDAALAPAAARAAASRGRERDEGSDPMRSAFERDRDRILHSKALRRLMHKTQVFINPEGDHYITRLTHTLQVTQIGRSLARFLGLNETLTEAICLGHDVGHSPFGHTGEEVISEYVPDEWLHSEQSLRVLDVLEPLNLTWETRDGIRAHSWKVDPAPATHEANLCRFADRIAYLTHDVDDAMRAGIITPDDLPRDAGAVFGEPGSAWITEMIRAVVDETLRRGEIAMEPGHLDAMHHLREFMFERVYLRPEMEPQRRRVKNVVRQLMEHFLANPDEIPETYRAPGADTLTRVVDYVSGMTDRYALRTHDELYRPTLF
jgi:dGTPase